VTAEQADVLPQPPAPARARRSPRQLLALLLKAATWTVIGVLGFLLNDAYSAVRNWMMDRPDYLQEMAKKQDIEFAEVKEGLARISRSIDNSGSDALNQVRSAVDGIRKTNAGLIQQLVLAKQENETLRLAARQRSGVSGGYDFILSAHSGIRIDGQTVLGLKSVHGTHVYTQLTSAAGNRATQLVPGQSIAYRSEKGEDCKVALLSINAASAGTASFALACTQPAVTESTAAG
jgi:hypothetical protein